jgi:hypothetical protein
MARHQAAWLRATDASGRLLRVPWFQSWPGPNGKHDMDTSITLCLPHMSVTAQAHGHTGREALSLSPALSSGEKEGERDVARHQPMILGLPPTDMPTCPEFCLCQPIRGMQQPAGPKGWQRDSGTARAPPLEARQSSLSLCYFLFSIRPLLPPLSPTPPFNPFCCHFCSAARMHLALLLFCALQSVPLSWARPFPPPTTIGLFRPPRGCVCLCVCVFACIHTASFAWRADTTQSHRNTTQQPTQPGPPARSKTPSTEAASLRASQPVAQNPSCQPSCTHV